MYNTEYVYRVLTLLLITPNERDVSFVDVIHSKMQNYITSVNTQ